MERRARDPREDYSRRRTVVSNIYIYIPTYQSTFQESIPVGDYFPRGGSIATRRLARFSAETLRNFGMNGRGEREGGGKGRGGGVIKARDALSALV